MTDDPSSNETRSGVTCHPEQSEGSAFVFALVVALAFLSVIPEGNLLLSTAHIQARSILPTLTLHTHTRPYSARKISAGSTRSARNTAGTIATMTTTKITTEGSVSISASEAFT